MIKIATRRGEIRGFIRGRADEVLYEYESLTQRLVNLGFTNDEITRAAARGIAAGEKGVEHDHM